MNYYTKHVFICTNQKDAPKACCAQSGGEPFFHYFKDKLKTLHLHGAGKIRVSKAGCLGRCALGPTLVIYPEAVWYTYASFADIDEIIDTHLLAGGRVHHLLIDPPESNGPEKSSMDD